MEKQALFLISLFGLQLACYGMEDRQGKRRAIAPAHQTSKRPRTRRPIPRPDIINQIHEFKLTDEGEVGRKLRAISSDIAKIRQNGWKEHDIRAELKYMDGLIPQVNMYGGAKRALNKKREMLVRHLPIIDEQGQQFAA